MEQHKTALLDKFEIMNALDGVAQYKINAP